MKFNLIQRFNFILIILEGSINLRRLIIKTIVADVPGCQHVSLLFDGQTPFYCMDIYTHGLTKGNVPHNSSGK